jgi:hypothetical protein
MWSQHNQLAFTRIQYNHLYKSNVVCYEIIFATSYFEQGLQKIINSENYILQENCHYNIILRI